MPSFIVKLHDHYFEYSTIVDAPVTFGMLLPDFEAYYRERYGSEGMAELPERMARVEHSGTSALGDMSSEKLMSGNKAGSNEANLTLDELYRAYCRREPIRDGWVAE